MRLLISLSLAVVLAVVALTACNSNDGRDGRTAQANAQSSAKSSPVVNPTGDGVRRITPNELRDDLANGTAVLVDVRSEETYKAEHIRGAINIPEGQIIARANELPRGKMIATYCS